MVDMSSRKPRFNVGDRVEVAGLGDNERKTGFVSDIVNAPIDAVYRYLVRFKDGTSAIYFGFELETAPPSSRASNY
jgi:hypothetical protein